MRFLLGSVMVSLATGHLYGGPFGWMAFGLAMMAWWSVDRLSPDYVLDDDEDAEHE